MPQAFKRQLEAEVPDVQVTGDCAGFDRARAREVAGAHLRRLDEAGRKIHAIFCTNDEMALGAADSLIFSGIPWAGDTVVAGVDGTPDARALIEAPASPLRATAVQDSYKVAEAADAVPDYMAFAAHRDITRYAETPNETLEQFPVAKEVSRDGGSEHFTAISLSDLIQAGGVILGILSPFVFAATARTRFAMALLICATVLLCGALYLVFARRARWRSIRVILQILLSVIMVTIAAAYANPTARATGNTGSSGGSAQPPGDTPTATNDTPAPAMQDTPAPAIRRAGYVLRPSSSPFTNTQDKVDLDTGCPGWGDMYPHIGPSRCGDLADLVIDPNSLHTADGQPDIADLRPGATGTESSCRALLSAVPDKDVNSIQTASLRKGEVLCVRTDMGNTAVVHVKKVTTDGIGQLTSVTINFQVWTAP